MNGVYVSTLEITPGLNAVTTSYTCQVDYTNSVRDSAPTKLIILSKCRPEKRLMLAFHTVLCFCEISV